MDTGCCCSGGGGDVKGKTFVYLLSVSAIWTATQHYLVYTTSPRLSRSRLAQCEHFLTTFQDLGPHEWGGLSVSINRYGCLSTPAAPAIFSATAETSLTSVSLMVTPVKSHGNDEAAVSAVVVLSLGYGIRGISCFRYPASSLLVLLFDMPFLLV